MSPLEVFIGIAGGLIVGSLIVAALFKMMFPKEKNFKVVNKDLPDLTDPLAQFTDDELEEAALRVISPVPTIASRPLYRDSEADAQRCREWITKWQVWVDTLDNKRLQRAYQQWIDVAKRDLVKWGKSHGTQVRLKAAERALPRPEFALPKSY